MDTDDRRWAEDLERRSAAEVTTHAPGLLSGAPTELGRVALLLGPIDAAYTADTGRDLVIVRALLGRPRLDIQRALIVVAGSVVALLRAEDPVVEVRDEAGARQGVDSSLATAVRACTGLAASMLADDESYRDEVVQAVMRRMKSDRLVGTAHEIALAEALAALAGGRPEPVPDLIARAGFSDDDGEDFLHAISIEAVAAADAEATVQALITWMEVRAALLLDAQTSAPPQTVPPPERRVCLVGTALARLAVESGALSVDDVPPSTQLPRRLFARDDQEYGTATDE